MNYTGRRLTAVTSLAAEQANGVAWHELNFREALLWKMDTFGARDRAIDLKEGEAD